MDIKKIRYDFPILQKKSEGKPIIYLDNACMTLRPKQVIEKMNDYYYKFPACAGRSIHKLGIETTIRYEESREKIKKFINAKESKEIIFTRNTTEGLNLISRNLKLKKGDIVLTTDREHNSNLVPWHIQKKLRGICHKVLKSNKDNTFNLEKFENIMSKKVKLVSIVHVSNLDGYKLPVREIIKIAHDYGSLVMIDGAQSAPRISIDVKKLDVDFFAFSFHKMLGPAGGALYGKHYLLEKIPPFNVGGNTVEMTTYDSSTFLKIPEKFEAGLQNYAGAIGAAAAADYIIDLGMKNIEKHESDLNRFITNKISNIPEISIIGPKNPNLRSGIITFNIKNIEPHNVAMFLDKSNIMVRSGVFCVHSWFKAHKINGAVRASFYIYNTKEECNVFIENIKKFIKKNRSL